MQKWSFEHGYYWSIALKICFFCFENIFKKSIFIYLKEEEKKETKVFIVIWGFLVKKKLYINKNEQRIDMLTTIDACSMLV